MFSMDAETVYKVAQALDNTQRERLRQLLNTNVESNLITKKKKKKQLWDRKRVKRANHRRFPKKSKRVQKQKHPPSPPLRGSSDKCYC